MIVYNRYEHRDISHDLYFPGKLMLHVVHFNVSCDWSETNPRHQKRYAKEGKKNSQVSQSTGKSNGPLRLTHGRIKNVAAISLTCTTHVVSSQSTLYFDLWRGKHSISHGQTCYF